MMGGNVNLRASQLGGLSHTPRILFGVTGGIAAYKAVTAVRRLRQWGADVVVVPTPAALEMVGITTWEAISGNPVHVHVSEDAHAVVHVNTGARADLFVVAPATANTIAKFAYGIADNLLTASALVATCPRLIAPAMHTQMWEHPATQANVELLRQQGWELIGPEAGQLTGKDIGMGRMSEPERIAERAIELLQDRSFDVALDNIDADATWVISAGGTREAIDPVRYIANNSSGIMGVELANAAYRNGHRVILVGANLATDVRARCQPGIEIVSAVSAHDIQVEMQRLAPIADVIIMAAAIGDFHVVPSQTKIKRSEHVQLDLKANPDILRELAAHRQKSGQRIVGFAAETGDENQTYIEYGIAKARRKGADLLVINQVGEDIGFGDVHTRVSVVTGQGALVDTHQGNKPAVARAIVSTIENQITK
ncbi:bifunctional phosphopantothenoylcysteine decarboxylase/phosphopantothenate--cysteine ligase CoaBC [Arcanobacterium phocae]|uniref:bifunctional phosphopantothenoylcysteine decarboxylase/phosphopantothenate--cysteine ligase CoaBC n=1 Tax=Arcanobacterium phocae TaxID=131112 RepID=UPI0020A00680|nr:bifunctional phosphopantothenoylcysteine decarboxylase/phosphopantothenate--cysteine ligase CoaBC [Arcanobacterium phocae]